ncbi:MAG: amylo-alpha-1,6-glucosidase [Bacteroidales bacterium]|nr:amylo-alpha-1,6-glucosidase [Bacteroidales bacterium]
MGSITFDKAQLINLEYSLEKELIRSNRAGAFSCTTILGCNTRKYHGLLICPQHQLDGELHVLLSMVDETVIQRDAAFHLGVNKYPGKFHPKGHKYVRDFSADIIPVVTYRVGGVVLTKETMFVTEKEMVLIRYTLVEAHSPTRIRLQPFLAFRNIHRLSKRNIDLNTKYDKAANGIRVKMYEGYSDLYLQCSRKNAEYVHAPDWYNDLEYIKEEQRGYECHEDLYVPGFFEMPIKKGESIVLSASTTEAHPPSLLKIFNRELSKRRPRDSYKNSLLNSAEQFFVVRNKKAAITEGYPWYDYSGRFTFISLPGLAMADEGGTMCEKVLEHMIERMKGPLFPESYVHQKPVYNAADTSLWFFRALQLCYKNKDKKTLWKQYGKVMRTILEGYERGTENGLRMHDNGLIFIEPSAGNQTWMNATIQERQVTPRYGYVVEVNALWYNAISFAVELAQFSGEKEFASKWRKIAEQIPDTFNSVFWYKEGGYLADYSFDGKMDLSVRPNQLIAAALPYTPLSEIKSKQVLDVVVKQLLTPRGLRSLSPQDPRYKGRYAGDAYARDQAFHQGTSWAWPLGLLADAWFKIYGKAGREFIEKLYYGFEETMAEAGIGSISEVYDGDPPHQPGGAISYAPSVAEMVRIGAMLGNSRKK